MVGSVGFKGSNTVPAIEGLNIIGAIAAWCECLQGSATFQTALSDLAEAIECEAIALSRYTRGSRSEAKAIVYDTLPNRSQLPRLERSYAQEVLGKYFEFPKAGSIWLSSMMDHEAAHGLLQFQSRRRFTELAIVPLSVGEKAVEFLELHFVHELNHDSHAVLNLTVDTLVRTWRNRKPGLLTEAILRRKAAEATVEDKSQSILSHENPARLSRAEFRLCLMFSRGYSNEAAQDELAISESTLRTHLRHIYQKTGVGSHSELLYRLLTVPVINAAEKRIA